MINDVDPEIEDWGGYGSYRYDFKNVNLGLKGLKKLGNYDYQGLIDWTASEADSYKLSGGGTLSAGTLNIGASVEDVVFSIDSSMKLNDMSIYASHYYSAGGSAEFVVDFDATAKNGYFMIEPGAVFDITDASLRGNTWMMIQGGTLVAEKYTHTKSSYMELLGESVLEGDLVLAGKSYSFTGKKYYDDYAIFNALNGVVHVNWTYDPSNPRSDSGAKEDCSCLTVTGNLSVTSKTAIVFYGGQDYMDSSSDLMIPQTTLVVFKCGSVNEKQLSLLVPYIEREIDETCDYCQNFDWSSEHEPNWNKCQCKYGSEITFLDDREFMARAGEDGFVHVYLGWKRDENGVPGNAIVVPEGTTVTLAGNTIPNLERPVFLKGGTADATGLDDEQLSNQFILGSSGKLKTTSGQTMSFVGSDTINYSLVGVSSGAAGAAMRVGNSEASSGHIKLSGEQYDTAHVEVEGGLLTISEKSKLGMGVNETIVSMNNEAGLTNFGTLEAEVILMDSSTALNQGQFDGLVRVGGDATYINNGKHTGELRVSGAAYGSGSFGTTLIWSDGVLHVDNESGVQKHASLTVFEGGIVTFLTPTEGAAPGADKHSVLHADTLTLEDGSILDVSAIRGRGSYTLVVYDSFTGNLQNVVLAAESSVNEYSLLHDSASKTITLNVSGMAVWQWDAKKASGTLGNGRNAALLGSAQDGFVAGDEVQIASAAKVTLQGKIEASRLLLSGDGAISLAANKMSPGTLTGSGCVEVSMGSKGKVTLNDGNSYTGGTIVHSGTVNAGGVSSFGYGEVTLYGGTLDLKGKAVANDIVLEGEACIKGGKSYAGVFTLSDGELLNGSQLNVAEVAVLSGGTMNGALSGAGTVQIHDNVTLGDRARITTPVLSVIDGAWLTVGEKGLNYSGKDSVLMLNGGIESAGNLVFNEVRATMGSINQNVEYEDGARPKLSVSVKNALELDEGAVYAMGSLSAGSLKLNAGSCSAQSIAVKGAVDMTDGNLATAEGFGKVAAGSLSMWDSSSIWAGELQLSQKNAANVFDSSDCTAHGNVKVAGSLAVQNGSSLSLLSEEEGKVKNLMLNVGGDLKVTDAYIETRGGISVGGDMTVASSDLYLSQWDFIKDTYKPLNLTVKKTLTLRSGSYIELTGVVSAKNMVLDGGTISMTSDKALPTIKVGGSLTLKSNSCINVSGCELESGKVYNLITFKSIGDAYRTWSANDTAESVDLYNLLGMDASTCTLTLNVKKKNITLCIEDMDAWNSWLYEADDEELLAAAESEACALSEEGEEEVEAPSASTALVNPALPDYSGVADALVQANWGLVESSRAFVNTIANRSMAVQLGSGERAVWASAIAGSSRRSSSGTHGGADTNITGGAIGMETQLGEGSLLGMALGNSWTRVSA
ncbi:MAG: hypothetical protein IKJ29_10425, partial [Akkermansia sp.]|nr:hypothetical protein [Akkermansia sp.]